MRKPRIKLPAQSWTIKEKIDWLVAVLTDQRLSYATRVIGATMALYFHNTQSGALHPSREQISEKTGAGRKMAMLATQALRRFGFLAYDDSDGGCHHRNTYQLLKQFPKVEALNRVEKDSLNRVEKDSPTGAKKTHVGESKRPTQLPSESTSCNETPEALPLPREGEASASEEKEEASRKHADAPAAPLEGPTQEERERGLARWEAIKRKLRGGSANE